MAWKKGSALPLHAIHTHTHTREYHTSLWFNWYRYYTHRLGVTQSHDAHRRARAIDNPTPHHSDMLDNWVVVFVRYRDDITLRCVRH